MPQRDGELAGKSYDGDAPHASLLGADARAEPTSQRTVGLVAQPHPGGFDHRGSGARIAGLADPLLDRQPAAAPRAAGQAEIAADLAAVGEVAIILLANQGGGKLRSDALEG